MKSSEQDIKLVQLLSTFEQGFKRIKQKRKQLNSLLRMTYQLPGVYKNGDRRYNNQDFEEAFQEALVAINFRNLQRFLYQLQLQNVPLSPENAARIRHYYVSRLNKITRNKLVDIYRYNFSAYSLDARKDETICFLELIADEKSSYPLDNLTNQEINQSIQSLIQSIIQDSNGEFCHIYPKGYPECHLSEVLRRRLQGETWNQMAEALAIPMGTLTAFWHRKCKPLLQERLIEFKAVLE